MNGDKGRGRGRLLDKMNSALSPGSAKNPIPLWINMSDEELKLTDRPFCETEVGPFFISAAQRKSTEPKSKEDKKLEVIGKEVEAAEKVDPFIEITQFHVLDAQSPSEFYMIRESDKLQAFANRTILRDLQEVMNKAESLRGEYEICAELQKCYVHLESRSGTWCRVRVLKIQNTKFKKLAYVYYIDKEFYEYIPLRGLRQLPDQFCHRVVPIFRCVLFGVLPKDGGCLWPSGGNNYFKAIINQGGPFYALPLSWSTKPENGKASTTDDDDDGIVDIRYDMGVEFFIPHPHRKPLLLSINYDMIGKGYGRFIGPDVE